MRRVRILIRYFDAQDEVLFEGEPNLRHAARVPVHWTRWEIYWDDELVQAGERPKQHQKPVERRGRPAPAAPGKHGKRSRDGARGAHADGDAGFTPPDRETRPTGPRWG